MDLKKILTKNIDLAFKNISSLTVDATLSKRIPKDFDFGVNPTQRSIQNLPVKAFILTKSKASSSQSSHSTKNVQAMLKASDTIDIDLYDQLLINKEIWSIGPVISNSGYTVLLNLFKE